MDDNISARRTELLMIAVAWPLSYITIPFSVTAKEGPNDDSR